ncbi:hypothetical protein FKG94_02850 [Exilibacterium tricleocarpae]|uniref:Uncharacterized protein n=1 Tax=Exilibacterium tricleocarpae TaxID=2591008 RepID=A0A545U6W1_9GAMM|nr:hypothetical protein [Exilibacterium tricleocarpae]TQV85143.1 hypothetical protein FKG94_02850 [Exilibacterium tricleocarpae]
MPGTSIGEFEKVGREGLVQKCKSVLAAGGTVYLGETHTSGDAREICCEILATCCVQYLCIEYDSSLQKNSSSEEILKMIDYQESGPMGHAPPVPMRTVIETCNKADTKVVLADNQLTTSKKRQRHFAKQVVKCRHRVDRAGRGVLVLIGSDHLKDVNGKVNVWRALQRIVYKGLSFVHGQWGTCRMVWQLS